MARLKFAVLFLVLSIALTQSTFSQPFLLNIDFGAGSDPSSKVGFAAAGQNTNDFWNFYTRDDGQGGWKTFGVLENLKLADQTITPVSISVANGPGAWGNGSVDPMYDGYIYPFDGGNLVVTVSNLPAGAYDVYAYCSDGNYEVAVGGVTYGIKTTYEYPVVNPPVWQAGTQYALFSSVVVTNQTLTLTVRPGTGGYAVLSGMQIVRRSGPVAPPAPILLNIDFGAGSGPSSKVGLAAAGQNTNDFWNFYSRDDDQGGWRTFGVLENLKLADQTVTPISISVVNGPGAWGNGSVDPMYDGYIYPFDGGNLVVTVSNLPAGAYDVYAYCSDGNYEVTVGGVSYGSKITYEYPVINPPAWETGKQYALFSSVAVTNQTLTLTVRPGTGGYAVLSGLQIWSASGPVGPTITTQPKSESVMAGQNATFTVSAVGSGTLTYQWRKDGSDLDGQTAASLCLSNVQSGDAAQYSVIVSNAWGTAVSSNATLTVNTPTVIPGDFLLNIDFGAGSGPSGKVGFAAAGQNTNDFWNFYTRDDGQGGWKTFGVLESLKLADQTVTPISISVTNGPGAWGNGSVDPMYVGYIYPFDGGNLVVTVSNLPAGAYDVYAYCSDGNYEVTVGGVSYGTKTTYEYPVSNPPVWRTGEQYALFSSVAVTNKTLTLTVRPGTGGYAVLSGLQIVRASGPVAPATATLLNIDFGAGAGPSGKVGFAAAGQNTNDFWNFYTRDDGQGGWRTFGVLDNLKLVGQTVTPISISVANGPGAWGIGSDDPMYNGYIYPFDGGNLVVAVSNLPAGAYDVYAYCSDGDYEVTVGGVSYGTKTTYEYPVANPPVWETGKQFALFSSVAVTNQTLTLTVRPGAGGYAVLSGMQIASASTPKTGSGETPLIAKQLLSPPKLSLSSSSDGIRVHLDHSTGRGSTIIYTSFDLKHWTPIFTNRPTFGPVDFLDKAPPGEPARFYKSVEMGEVP